MNFDDTPQEAAFRAEARAWIQANAPKQYEEELRKSSLGRSALPNILEVAKAWQRKKADAGWACLHWPKEYGGGGLSKAQAKILDHEMTKVGAFNPIGGMGVMMFGPTLLEYGDEKQKRQPGT